MRHADHDDTRAAIADGMHRITIRNVGAARHDLGDRRYFRSCRQFPGNCVEGWLQGLGLNSDYLAIYLAVPIVILIGLANRHRNLLWPAPAAACLPELLATKSRSGFLALAGPALGALLAADLRNRAWSQLAVRRIAVAGPAEFIR